MSIAILNKLLIEIICSAILVIGVGAIFGKATVFRWNIRCFFLEVISILIYNFTQSNGDMEPLCKRKQ